MNCPICKNVAVEDESMICPQCQSNLGVFYYIKKIDERIKKMKKYILWLSMLLLLFLIGGVLMYISFVQLKTKKNEIEKQLITSKDQNGKIEELTNENSMLHASVDDLKQQLENIQTLEKQLSVQSENKDNPSIENLSSKETIHVVKEGENLWKIAEQYYGNGFKYNEIAKENNIAEPNLLYKGLELKIKN